MSPDELVDLYISLKRIFYGKPIKAPKKDSKDYDNLSRLAVLLTEQGIPCDEFLLVNVRAYKRKNVFPYTPQLLGMKALNRYNEYAHKRYKMGKLFKVDPHSVFIYKTNVYYPIEEFLKPFDRDMKALMIFSFVREGKYTFEEEKGKKIQETAEYLLAKYEWYNQIPPDSLLEWKEKLDDTKTNSVATSNGLETE